MLLLSKVVKTPYIKDEMIIEVKEVETDKSETVDADIWKTEADELIKEAEKNAASIIETAEKEAQQIIKNAQDKLKDKLKEAHALGFEQGYKDGLAKADKEAEKLYENINDLMHQVNQIHEDIAQEAEEQLTKLAVSIAEKIVTTQLDIKPAVIVDMTKKALQSYRQAEQITIYVHPDDENILKQHKGELIEMLGENSRLYILGDANLNRGDCRIESEKGFIDASIKTQLEKIGIRLLGEES